MNTSSANSTKAPKVPWIFSMCKNVWTILFRVIWHTYRALHIFNEWPKLLGTTYHIWLHNKVIVCIRGETNSIKYTFLDYLAGAELNVSFTRVNLENLYLLILARTHVIIFCVVYYYLTKMSWTIVKVLCKQCVSKTFKIKKIKKNILPIFNFHLHRILKSTRLGRSRSPAHRLETCKQWTEDESYLISCW